MENPKRENRQRVAGIVLENKKLIKDLVSITFMVDDKISIKAAWVLEWLCNRNLDLLAPYLDEFTNNIHSVKHDSAVRSIAKICELLAKSYTAKDQNFIKKSITSTHIEKIIEAGFDWLITPQKIAVRAYTMETLYLFGLDKNWVHRELKHLISTKIIHQSKGCKARGKKILEWINSEK